MIYSLGFIAFVFGGIIWLLISGYDAGRYKEKKESLEGIIDDIHTAHQARERYLSDPEYAQRMRDKYRKK